MDLKILNEYNQNWAKTTLDMEKDIAYAQDSVRKHIEEVKKDKTRPKYHFASPSGNLLDTWGAFFYKNEYHLFYDINADNSLKRYAGYFGHIKSDDLTYWKNLPIALAPEADKGELQLNDGCITLDGKGRPLMWYTRVFNDDKRPREHIAVRGDEDMVKWERIKEVPPITMQNHGGPEFHVGWSDPIIFSDSGRTFMIISKCVTKEGNKNVIPIYEAKDDMLLSWEYKGVFLDETGEVLNFIKIDKKWVLIHSPYNNPVWIVGDFDAVSCKFIPEKRGQLSYGYINQGLMKDVSRGFYATSALTKPSGENLIFGWVSGFDSPEPRNWMGAVGIPRSLSLDGEQRIKMLPVKEFEKLRLNEIKISANKQEYRCSNAFEMKIEFSGLNSEVIIDINGTKISLGDEEFKLRDISVEAKEYGKAYNLHLYIDVSMAELFINDGICSITRCIPALEENVRVKITATADAINGSIWNLKDINN